MAEQNITIATAVARWWGSATDCTLAMPGGMLEPATSETDEDQRKGERDVVGDEGDRINGYAEQGTPRPATRPPSGGPG